MPGREKLLHELAKKYDFLFIPRMISTVYSEDKNEVLGWTFKYNDIHKSIRRRYVKNLDAVPALDNALVSYYDVGMTTGQVEVARGCPASCLFAVSTDSYVVSEGIRHISELKGGFNRIWCPKKDVYYTSTLDENTLANFHLQRL